MHPSLPTYYGSLLKMKKKMYALATEKLRVDFSRHKSRSWVTDAVVGRVGNLLGYEESYNNTQMVNHEG